jgi:hypothetical protein
VSTILFFFLLHYKHLQFLTRLSVIIETSKSEKGTLSQKKTSSNNGVVELFLSVLVSRKWKHVETDSVPSSDGQDWQERVPAHAAEQARRLHLFHSFVAVVHLDLVPAHGHHSQVPRLSGTPRGLRSDDVNSIQEQFNKERLLHNTKQYCTLTITFLTELVWHRNFDKKFHRLQCVVEMPKNT